MNLRLELKRLLTNELSPWAKRRVDDIDRIDAIKLMMRSRIAALQFWQTVPVPPPGRSLVGASTRR